MVNFKDTTRVCVLKLLHVRYSLSLLLWCKHWPVSKNFQCPSSSQNPFLLALLAKKRYTQLQRSSTASNVVFYPCYENCISGGFKNPPRHHLSVQYRPMSLAQKVCSQLRLILPKCGQQMSQSVLMKGGRKTVLLTCQLDPKILSEVSEWLLCL